MKKLLAVLLSMTLLLSSLCCGALAEAADITGEWYASLFGITMTMTVNEDGTYLLSLPGEEDTTGAWTLNDSSLVLDPGTDNEAAFAYDGESLSANFDDVDFIFTREPVAAFEPAAARTDAALEEFAGVWGTTLIDMMGMQLEPAMAGLTLTATIDGTNVTLLLDMGDAGSDELAGEAVFADAMLTLGEEPETEDDEAAIWQLALLEDGSMSIVGSMLGISLTFYMSPAELAQ